MHPYAIKNLPENALLASRSAAATETESVHCIVSQVAVAAIGITGVIIH